MIKNAIHSVSMRKYSKNYCNALLSGIAWALQEKQFFKADWLERQADPYEFSHPQISNKPLNVDICGLNYGFLPQR